MDFAAVVAAAGMGVRMGGSIRKQYLVLEGIPVLARSLKLFLEHPRCREVVAVIPPGEEEAVKELLRPYIDLQKIVLVPGGASRRESVGRGIAVLSGRAELIAVHDAARPLASKALLDTLLDAASRWGAAVPVLPLSDTVKEIDGQGFIISTPARDKLRRVQTPQLFKRKLIIRAYSEAETKAFEATDDASLVEALGEPVATVDGEEANLKITSPGDLALASFFLKEAGY